jgi:phage protein U
MLRAGQARAQHYSFRIKRLDNDHLSSPIVGGARLFWLKIGSNQVMGRVISTG